MSKEPGAIHQAGLSSGTGLSGSTAWSNTVRSRLYLTRPSTDDDVIVDENERVLKRVKANYAPTGDTLDLVWKDGAFAFIGPPLGVFVGMAKRNAETAFLDGLDAHTRAGRNLADSTHSGNYAPRVVIRTPHGKGFKVHQLAGAMERLFADGKICMNDYGRPSDRRRRIVRNQQETGDECCGGDPD